jgi:hypothetical protein
VTFLGVNLIPTGIAKHFSEIFLFFKNNELGEQLKVFRRRTTFFSRRWELCARLLLCHTQDRTARVEDLGSGQREKRRASAWGRSE